MFSSERLAGNFGVAIRGLDAARRLDDATMRALTEALYAHRIIVLKQQKFDQDNYLVFGKRWGTPIPHVLDHMRMPGYPDLLVVGNTEPKDRDVAIRNGAALWHTDQSYEAVPASATMLYSISAPALGGETRFCDMVAAYEGLDEATRARIGDLEMAHSYGAGTRREDEFAANPIVDDAQRSRVPVIHHPLVRRHPISGHKALYALGHGAHAIKGMARGEAERLIEELRDHVLQGDYLHAHRYEVGDLVIWDTLSTMHAAVPIDIAEGSETARLLWRISVRGRPDVYAQAA